MSDVRSRACARKEHIARDLALDRIRALAVASAVDEGKPLVTVDRFYRDLANLGLLRRARENDILADIAQQTEVNALGRDIEILVRHADESTG